MVPIFMQSNAIKYEMKYHQKYYIFLFIRSTYLFLPQVSQSRFNPKRAPREDLGAVLKPNIEPKLDEYHWYFF